MQNNKKSDQHPFQCDECDSRPRSDFTIYEPTDDWLIAYPEKNLAHIHYGKSSFDDKSNIDAARFHLNWVLDLTARFPKKKFFWIVDMRRKDDSEILLKEARDILKKIRTHPQMPMGAIFGFTWAMRMLLNLLNMMGGTAVLVDSAQEARVAFQKWKSTYKGE